MYFGVTLRPASVRGGSPIRTIIQLHKPFKPSALSKPSNVPVLGRTRLLANLQTQASLKASTQPGPPTTYPLLKTFLSQYIWPWITNYFKHIFQGKYKPYPYYPPQALDSGVYPIRSSVEGTPIKLALAGDWGTGTQESYEIGCSMTAWKPDYTVHLGDVYYVGGQAEVDENFLGKLDPGSKYIPIKWPTGAIGEFALIGNHEMYVGGGPYFKSILPTLRTGTGQFQKASFFALETEHWRIIALDTGYNSVGLPILGSIPWIKKLPFVGADCRLEDRLIEWLRTMVNPRQNLKPTLLLSHHQYYSAFGEEISGIPAQQLMEFFAGQNVVWVWAHEHRVALYDLFGPAQGLNAYGRCLGNGGMPVECGIPNGSAPITFYDPRCDYPLDDQSCAGWNGWCQLTLDGPVMRLSYVDLRDNVLFTETFTGAPDGSLAYAFTPQAGTPSLQPPAAKP